MRIAVVGAGPAGIYFSYLWKRNHPEDDITVFERQPPGNTFGFGVVFSDRAFEFLRDDDPETVDLITPHCQIWQDMTLVLPKGTVVLDGIGFSAIERLELLQLLRERAKSVGIEPLYEHSIDDLDELAEFDLIIGADGVISMVRTRLVEEFGTRIQPLTNRFAWFGTTKRFNTLTQTFRETEHGFFNAHSYPYSADMSTFIVETDSETFERVGFASMSNDESVAFCERIFAEDLDGHDLTYNRIVWREFPRISNARWSTGNKVLVGDALRTAHYSIGSGTRLAMEDVIVLAQALEENPDDILAALVAFEKKRRPAVETLTTAANTSADWYENFRRKMSLEPLDFAMSYLRRSGRLDYDRLRKMSPKFVALYEQSQKAPENSKIQDLVSDDCPGAQEIGFTVPKKYNASSILFDNLECGNGDRVAVQGPGGSLTYSELCADANRAGNALASLGLERGERIVLLLDDTPAYPGFLFGAIRAGFVPVLINTLMPADLLQYFVEDSGASVLVTDAELTNINELAEAGLETIISVGSDTPQANAGLKVVQAGPWLETFDTDLSPADTSGDDMAFWLYSSGTTGRPKGIVHLQHDMAYVAESYGKHIVALSPDDICYSPPKIFFAYGLGNSLILPLSVGASSLLVPGRPDTETVLHSIAQYRPTVFFGLPTLYTALTPKIEDSDDLASLRLCISAAETLSEQIANQWKSKTGLSIVEGLGSSEMLHIYLSNTAGSERIGSAGKRVPGYEVKLLDPLGNHAATDEEGVLWVRGQSSAPCYWNRSEQTTATMRNDWIYTGDRFINDDDGYFFFRGRADDLIKIAGQWVYPIEVERCLAEHENVHEVAVVPISLPDERMSIKAFVVPLAECDKDEFSDELKLHVKTTLAPYKYPRQIEFVDELPKTGTGKIDRQKLLSTEH